jgi:hypothetical protein
MTQDIESSVLGMHLLMGGNEGPHRMLYVSNYAMGTTALCNGVG